MMTVTLFGNRLESSQRYLYMLDIHILFNYATNSLEEL